MTATRIADSLQSIANAASFFELVGWGILCLLLVGFILGKDKK